MAGYHVPRVACFQGAAYLAVHRDGNALKRTKTKGHGHDDSDSCPVRRPRSRVAEVERSASSLVDSVRKALGNWSAYRGRALAELNSLTDRQLGDVGMARTTLTGTARRAVYGNRI